VKRKRLINENPNGTLMGEIALKLKGEFKCIIHDVNDTSVVYEENTPDSIPQRYLDELFNAGIICEDVR
jgi:hypothetical protein